MGGSAARLVREALIWSRCRKSWSWIGSLEHERETDSTLELGQEKSGSEGFVAGVSEELG